MDCHLLPDRPQIPWLHSVDLATRSASQQCQRTRVVFPQPEEDPKITFKVVFQNEQLFYRDSAHFQLLSGRFVMVQFVLIGVAYDLQNQIKAMFMTELQLHLHQCSLNKI